MWAWAGNSEPFPGFHGEGQSHPRLDPTDPFHGDVSRRVAYRTNVLDDATTASFTVNLWDWDFGASNPDPIDIDPAWGMGNATDCAYTFVGSAFGNDGPYAGSLTVHLTTIAPSRATVEVLAPLDYAGIYNITDVSGNAVSRRYLGEPRFVAFTVEHKLYRSSGEVALYLVPRSLFADTQFADLLGRKALPSALANSLSFAQNGTAAANSDPVQIVFAGHLSREDVASLESLLTTNASGGLAYRLVPVDPYLVVLGLPDDAVRLAGYTPFPHATTVNYTWDVASGLRNGWSVWDLIWYGVASVFDEVLNWIRSAIVFVVNVVDAIVQALLQFDSWLFNDVIAPAAQAVASAVQAAAKVVEQFFDAVVDVVMGLVTAAFNALIKPVVDMINAFVDGIVGTFRKLSTGVDADVFASELVAVMFGSQLFFALLLMVVGVSVAEKVTMVGSGGFGALVMHLIVPLVRDFLIAAIVGLAVVKILDSVLPSEDKIPGLVPSEFETAGKLTFGFAKFFQKFGLYYAALTRGFESLPPIEFAFFHAMATFIVFLVGVMLPSFFDATTAQVGKVLLDGAAIFLAFKTLPSLGKAKGSLSRAYPLMFPVGEALGTVSQVSAAATLIADVAVLGDLSGLW